MLVLASITNKFALDNLSEDLKNDKEFAIRLIKNNGETLEFLSCQLQDDEELVMSAVKQNGGALKFASQRLKDNKEIVLQAVKDKGYTLQWASDRLKGNKEVVLEACKNSEVAYYFSTPEFREKFPTIEVLFSLEKKNRNAWTDKINSDKDNQWER